MSKQLFTVGAVDHIGKHVFIKGFESHHGLQPVYGSPVDAVYIGTQDDIDRFIDRCRNELATDGHVEYIPYIVKSDFTNIELYDGNDHKVGTFTKH